MDKYQSRRGVGRRPEFAEFDRDLDRARKQASVFAVIALTAAFGLAAGAVYVLVEVAQYIGRH